MAWSTESRHKRGYGSAWDKLRAQVLKRDGYLCQCAECKGGALRLTVANEVDHVVSKAAWLRQYRTMTGVDGPSNLQAIGRECHKRKTIEETGKTFTPRVRIGADGYPVEDGPVRAPRRVG